MGESTFIKDNATYSVFFSIVRSIIDSYPVIYQSRGSNKPHSAEYREFASKWGNIKTLYEIADEKIEKVAEIYQMYLADYFQFLSYMIEKAEMDEKENAYQDMIRKAKKGRN